MASVETFRLDASRLVDQGDGTIAGVVADYDVDIEGRSFHPGAFTRSVTERGSKTACSGADLVELRDTDTGLFVRLRATGKVSDLELRARPIVVDNTTIVEAAVHGFTATTTAPSTTTYRPLRPSKNLRLRALALELGSLPFDDRK